MGQEALGGHVFEALEQTAAGALVGGSERMSRRYLVGCRNDSHNTKSLTTVACATAASTSAFHTVGLVTTTRPQVGSDRRHCEGPASLW